MSIDCVVVDAGARYGLHPTWADLRGLIDLHLFEMDPEEADRLRSKYQNDPRIIVYPLALFSRDTTLEYKVRAHRGLNSLFENNEEVLLKNDYMLREFAASEERTAEARALDGLFQDRPVHFLKLDVEGAELEVLKGAVDLLGSTVLGVRSEVLFSPIFQGAPLFGELNAFLLDKGFELLNLDYTGAGNKTGQFTLPGRYGKLVSSDAVWIVNDARLFNGSSDTLYDVIRLAVFLMNNGATDLAVSSLLRAVTVERLSVDGVREDPLFGWLRRKVLFLFKAMLSLPMIKETEITETYAALFGEEFPIMSQFYETVS